MPRKHNDALPRDKLLDLYQRLTLGSGKHFQADVARELGCSPQTVVRLIGVIERHLGKDAEIESGLEGRRRYYRLRSNAHAKALGFSFEELHFLAICRDLAAPRLPAGIVERIDRTLMSLALQLDEGQRQRPAGHHAMGFRPKGYIDYGPHLATIAGLRLAIEKRQVCRVIYRANGRGEARPYRYAPGRILAMGAALYVQGYRLSEGSLLRDRPTTFSLHRIAAIAPTGEHFSFDAADENAKGFGLNWHKPRRARILVAPEAADYVRDRIWSDDQSIEEHPDGSLTLAVTSTSDKELNAWVWSFGGLANIVDVRTIWNGECDEVQGIPARL